MEQRNLTCIGCPMGCALTVRWQEGKVCSVEGNTCKRGKEYAEQEVVSPVRTVTSTVRVQGGRLPVVSVKTEKAIPKDKMFACIQELKVLRVKAPVAIGQVLLSNAAGTHVDIIATKTVEKQ